MARILLAEDDVAVCDFVRRALEMDGHDVVPVHDGGEALERLMSPLEEFDMLLSDIRMPVVDGVAPGVADRARQAGTADSADDRLCGASRPGLWP